MTATFPRCHVYPIKDFRINELIFSSLQPPEIGIITPILRLKEMKWQLKASECQKLDLLAQSVCLYMSHFFNCAVSE